MRQWIALSLLCMSALLLPLSASAACESPIKFGALTWESGQFTSGVLKYIAEEGYGCTVEEVPGAGPALETALSQNDIQIIGEQWIGRSPIMENAIEQNKVAV
ncbi:MAG: glycine betaine ABC transporter substrate-binding protein, partial [Pseudomonadota bacterium]|nr:glycine betaine ABC transporter substrate-binding protein [Pseudomonadota bacterium]